MISVLTASLALTLLSAERPVSVWTEPLATVGLLGLSVRTTQFWVYVPVGLNFFIGELELQAEVTLSYQHVATGGDGPEYETWSGLGSLGTVFRPHQGNAFDGLFLSPKIYLESGRTTNVTNLPGQFDAPYTFWNVQGGLDAGYRWVFGHFELALVAGAGVGYGAMPGVINSFMGFTWHRPTEQLVVSVNLNLMRVGVRF
jgi:hypothetical protein